MTGLFDERRGRKGPTKLTEEVSNFLDNLGPRSAAEVARALGLRHGRVAVPSEHPTGAATMRRFWPVGEPAQADYERLRAAVVSGGRLPTLAVSARFGPARPGRPHRLAGCRGRFRRRRDRATRPSWTPYADPCLEALAVTYQLLLAEAGPGPQTALTAFTGSRP